MVISDTNCSIRILVEVRLLVEFIDWALLQPSQTYEIPQLQGKVYAYTVPATDWFTKFTY